MWGCFLISGVKILQFLKDWWKSIPIHQNYTMALSVKFLLYHDDDTALYNCNFYNHAENSILIEYK